MQELVKEFTLSKEQLLFEAQQVEKQMEKGINGETSDFAMMPSYMGLPSGQEEGRFLALDFGGSNLRIARMVLEKNQIRQEALQEKSLNELLPEKDGKITKLFSNIAILIDDFAGNEGGLLGHTFSYPIIQTGINDGRLKKWTKELSFTDAQNTNINNLLTEKLEQVGRKDILPVAILNDTTAVLLATCYETGTPDIIGSICGTGHNSAYYEPTKKMIINMEAGNFSPCCQNRFDKLLDKKSNSPNEQLLEKMVTGNYLAALTKLVAQEYGINDTNIHTTLDLTIILQEKNNLLYPTVCSIIKRAANLIAAEYFGIYNYLKKHGIILKRIALDGSIYNKMPLFNSELLKALAGFIAEPPSLVAGHGSSLKGAAVACTFARQRCF